MNLRDMKESILSMSEEDSLHLHMKIRESRRIPKGIRHERKVRKKGEKVLGVLSNLSAEEIALVLRARGLDS